MPRLGDIAQQIERRQTDEFEKDRVRHSGNCYVELAVCEDAFDAGEAEAMAGAGADILIPHMGLTTKGSIGAHQAPTLEESAKRVQEMCDAARRIKADILVLCHGGPIAEPEDAQYILDHTDGVVGFYGASSTERLPVEPAIINRVREFTKLKFSRS